MTRTASERLNCVKKTTFKFLNAFCVLFDTELFSKQNHSLSLKEKGYRPEYEHQYLAKQRKNKKNILLAIFLHLREKKNAAIQQMKTIAEQGEEKVTGCLSI